MTQRKITHAELALYSAKELHRVIGLVELAYFEGVLDVQSRGATLENMKQLWETSDVAQCIDDPKAQEQLLSSTKSVKEPE